MGFNPFIGGGGGTSSEDKVARAEIAAIKDGENLDSFSDVEAALSDKVDKETGKGLSTNDYTTIEKEKLAGIAEGAEVNEIQGIKVNSSTVNPDANKVVNITVPTSAADVSALPDTTKYAATLSLTINSSTFVMTGQLKDQNGDNLGTAQTIDLPLESVVVGGSYNSQTKKVVLTLQNGNTIEFSVADLVSGLQTELSASNKLNPAYINYDSTHRAVSDTEKSTWNSKQNAIDSSHKLSADLVDDTNATNKFATAEELEQIQTNKNNILSIYNTGFAQKNVMHIVLDEVKALQSWATFINNTITFGNIAVTFNDDNSITLNGSHTADVAINFKDLSHINIPTNAVGAASANITLSDDIFFGLWGDSGVPNLVLNDGVDIPSDYASKYSRGFIIRVSANTVCNNVRIYPMVCDKVLYQASSEVVPYALPNTTITSALQECVDNGAKNRLPATSTTTSTNNGLTLVVNSDYSITITGKMTTAENTDIYFLGSWENTSPFANYTGKNMRIYCKSSASIDGQFKIYDRTARKGYAVAINNNEGAGISGDLTAAYFTIAATANAINVTLYPMICDPALWAVSQQYEPYVMSNAELTVKEQQNENNILFNALNGVINMTDIADITLSSDGYLANKVGFNAPAGTYRLKSAISGGTAKYTVVARMGNTEVYRGDTTVGSPNINHTFTLTTAADSISLWIQIQSGTSVAISNTMVYPAALGDIPYQPYAMSNAELTAAIQALQAQLANQ